MENNQWLDYATSNDTPYKNTLLQGKRTFFCTFQFYLFLLHILVHIRTFYCAKCTIHSVCFPGWTWRGSTLRDYTIKWIRNEITPPTRYFQPTHSPCSPFLFSVRSFAEFAVRSAAAGTRRCVMVKLRHAPSVVMRMWCYMRAGGRCSFIWRGWNGS